MSGPSGERCEDCYFWDAMKSGTVGVCRNLIVDKSGTRYFDWCGEYKERKDDEQQS